MRRPIIAMFPFGVLLLSMTLDLVLQRWQGILLIFLGLSYFAWDFFQHSRDGNVSDSQEAQSIATVLLLCAYAVYLAIVAGLAVSTRG